MLVLIIGGAGAALLFSRSGPKADAAIVPTAARIERVDGDVGLAHSLDPNNNDDPDWLQAGVNTPVTVGDRIYARDNSHASIAFTGRNYCRLDPGAAVDVLSLAEQRTQLALRSGSALFDVGELPSGELFEVATPGGAVDFTEPGLYQLGIGDDGNTIVSVLNGLAQVVGLEGSGQVGKGEVLTLVAQAATQALASKLAPDLAGNIVNDYYRDRYPNTYDGRYANYDTYLNDPDYYDPYSHSASYSYLSDEIPGLYDLDQYGDWSDVDGYGRCWTPRVDADWSPYRSGYWDVSDTWGATWIADEPWGWAPYHYGRWAYANNRRWVWVPEDCRTNPVYAPALVTFIPLQQTNQIGWCPLGPGERYYPRYYDADFRPRYFGSNDVEVIRVQRNYVNYNYPNAVTVVPLDGFRRRIDRRVIVPANAQLIAQSQAVADPFAVESLRQIARQRDFADRRLRIPREARFAKFNTPVVTSVAPALPPVRSDVAKAFQVQAVTDKQKRNKLQVNDSGQVVAARRPDGLPQTFTSKVAPAVNPERQHKMAELAQRVQQGDKTAQPELRQLKREQRREERAVNQQAVVQQQQVAAQQAAAQKAAARQTQQAAAQQAAGQQQSRKELKQIERQQRAAGQQAQADQTRAQLKAQRQAARQQQQQQTATAQQAQQKVQRQQAVQQQQQAERSQKAAAQQAQANQQREQMRAARQQQAEQQRQAATQKAAQQAQQTNQAREARKAQRQAEAGQRQQQMQQQRQVQVQQQRQQQAAQQRKQAIQIQQAERNRQQQKPMMQQQQRQQVQQRQVQVQQQRQQQMQQQRQQQRAPAMMGPPAKQGQPAQGGGKPNKRKP